MRGRAPSWMEARDPRAGVPARCHPEAGRGALSAARASHVGEAGCRGSKLAPLTFLFPDLFVVQSKAYHALFVNEPSGQQGEPSMTDHDISPIDPHPRRTVKVLDTTMSYVDVGSGDAIVFLHGNPTSSYLWRNVIPHVAGLGRCLAPDLVGMGDSPPSPSGSYRFRDHARYLSGWFDAVGLRGSVVLVVHDWGSALGFDWARRHFDQVRGIAYMEGIVQPRRWEDFAVGRDRIFRALRSEDGERLIREQNLFVEAVLPKSVLRALQSAEMDAYRRPFVEPAARTPTLTWARELPIDGTPSDVVAVVEAYGQWLAASPIPKLFVNAEPGALLTGRSRQFCRTWPNQREVTVPGVHYVQEDSPHQIGRALHAFITELFGRAPAGERQKHQSEKEYRMAEVSIIYCKPCGYAGQAADAAAALQKQLKLTASLSAGTGGIFEVRVNDKVVARRSKGHFPGTTEIVASVAAALKA